MASIASAVVVPSVLASYKGTSTGGSGGGSIRMNQFSSAPSFPAVSGGSVGRRRASAGVVRAEVINSEIRKSEEKVVDSVVVTELSKPLTAYCRCWRSGTFPLCDGSHVKHNKATGDNVGPLLLKKP